MRSNKTNESSTCQSKRVNLQLFCQVQTHNITMEQNKKREGTLHGQLSKETKRTVQKMSSPKK